MVDQKRDFGSRLERTLYFLGGAGWLLSIVITFVWVLSFKYPISFNPNKAVALLFFEIGTFLENIEGLYSYRYIFLGLVWAVLILLTLWLLLNLKLIERSYLASLYALPMLLGLGLMTPDLLSFFNEYEINIETIIKEIGSAFSYGTPSLGIVEKGMEVIEGNALSFHLLFGGLYLFLLLSALLMLFLGGIKRREEGSLTLIKRGLAGVGAIILLLFLYYTVPFYIEQWSSDSLFSLEGYF